MSRNAMTPQSAPISSVTRLNGSWSGRLLTILLKAAPASATIYPIIEYLSSGRPHERCVRLLTSVELVAWMGLVHFFDLLQDLTQVVGFGGLHRRIRDVAF
jgi:hypothetical protein